MCLSQICTAASVGNLGGSSGRVADSSILVLCVAALASISNEAEVDSGSDDVACTSGRGRHQDDDHGRSPERELRRRDSGPPHEMEVPSSARLRRAMSDPIERFGSLSRRRSARLSDADAATAAAALAGDLPGSLALSHVDGTAGKRVAPMRSPIDEYPQHAVCVPRRRNLIRDVLRVHMAACRPLFTGGHVALC